MARVFVAMSGGVDSSVAAALLHGAGHDVTGITMQLLPQGDAPGECCGTDAVLSARRVAGVLGIPHYTWDLREAFEREVVSAFAREYASGRTPNPCIRCNDLIKFGVLLDKATAAGADLLATGHYARVVPGDSGMPRLARGVDRAKDQSYFLYRLTQDQLGRVVFPLGDFEKSRVKEIAATHGLPSASRAESQEVCFCAPGEHVPLIVGRFPEAGEPGDIMDAEGNVLGMHRGLAHYTVGQRKRLGIAGAEPLYVTALRAAENQVVVGPASDLAATRVIAAEAVWRSDSPEAEVDVQTRYRMVPVRARVRSAGDTLDIELSEPIAGVAPGQAVVCYEGDTVVGGGVVEAAE
ncbi:MAG: tRNA 2-thiouridine(34) synthase MnmA [Actinomycetota bacterium]|nr:tRNA 2-thiouridine(34) synthase MnmA [Actinomycetota bacterium]